MRLATTAALLLCLLPAAYADRADQAGSACYANNAISMPRGSIEPGAEVLTCIEDHWRVTSHIGTENVRVVIKVFDGKSLIMASSGVTLDGVPSHPGSFHEDGYAERTPGGGLAAASVRWGVGATLTPVLRDDGQIALTSNVDVVSLDAMNQQPGGESIPQTSEASGKQYQVLPDGGNTTFQFGGGRYTANVMVQRL